MKKQNRKNQLQALANFVYEIGILNRTPRSGLWFLGSGHQSVAEHAHRTTLIAYILAELTPKVDKYKMLLMALFHDLAEGRTSDLNHIHQKYGRLDETKALEDIASILPFGNEMKKIYQEYKDKKSIESQLVKDADHIDWIASLCEETARGNQKAKVWIKIAIKRLKTSAGKTLGNHIVKTHPDDWWFNPKDPWFIDRAEQFRKWDNKKPKPKSK